MKIPLIPIYLMTSKTLEEKLSDARAFGVIEGKGYSRVQIRKLLSDNAAGPVRIKAGKKKGC